MTSADVSPAPRKKNVLVNLASGGLSGLASCLLLQPLDLLKTRLQQTERIDQQYVGNRLVATARGVLANEGVGGLWKGTAPTVARNVPGVALYFTTLTRLREYIARPDSLLTHLRSTASSTIPTSAWPRLSVLGDITTGATARVAVGFILMPVTVVKARAESTLYPQTSIYRSMRALLAEGGVRALWQGFVPTSLRDGPYAGLFVLSYERSKMALNHVHLGGRPLPTGARDSAAGALGAVFATFLTAPFDTIKTKRQLRPLEYTSIARSVALIASRKGMVGFFEGAALRMARKAGSSAIAWSLYEGLVRRYQR